MPKVFISATSRDLKSYREVITLWARSRDYEPVVQDEFPVESDYNTVVQMLRDKMAPCDAVIHLAGLYYGFEPSHRPDGEPLVFSSAASRSESTEGIDPVD